jgi:hypothetical protein
MILIDLSFEGEFNGCDVTLKPCRENRWILKVLLDLY